jgi:hypothetical protein
MEPSQIERVCEGVAAAVFEVRTVFRSAPPVSEILNRFWALQDQLSRLLEAITDHPLATMEVLDKHAGLLADVVDVLEFSSKLPSLRSIAAVRESGESINASLLEIQYMRQTRAMAASA